MNGFASLSLVDAGFYGVGMYFTTHAVYACPYFISSLEPAIVLSYLIPGMSRVFIASSEFFSITFLTCPGNAYPTVESPHSPESLQGSNLRRGYQSHYVITNGKGMPTERGTSQYDEIVINQESQVCPAFIIELDSSNFSSLVKGLQREINVPPRQDFTDSFNSDSGQLLDLF
jgi:hypothetical protein